MRRTLGGASSILRVRAYVNYNGSSVVNANVHVLKKIGGKRKRHPFIFWKTLNKYFMFFRKHIKFSYNLGLTVNLIILRTFHNKCNFLISK